MDRDHWTKQLRQPDREFEAGPAHDVNAAAKKLMCAKDALKRFERVV